MTNTTTYQEYPNANRNYKDALFRMAFFKKEDLLDLYNAINDSSYSDPDGFLECKVTMLNINYGRNSELMEKCQRLKEYSYFVDRVRYYVSLKVYPLSTCINLAIEECIQNGILVDILTTQRAEVHEMLLYTFDQELHEKNLKNEAKIEGKIEAQLEIIQRLFNKDMSPDDISKLLDMDIQEVNNLIAKIK